MVYTCNKTAYNFFFGNFYNFNITTSIKTGFKKYPALVSLNKFV